MKAILIARVSTEEQREAGNSLPAQVARLEKYCQGKNYQIMKVCSFDESAYTTERSEFDRIIDFIISQKEKIIVCCDKVDRLSRNVFDKRISALYEKALNDEIELHFASEGQVISSKISAVEKFQFSISLGLAKYYSDAISDNVKRAIEQKLRKGEWLGKAPYGYKNIKKPDGSTDIVIDEYWSHIIKIVYELYATGAYSMDMICKKLKAEHGIAWRKGNLTKLLENPFYYGVMVVKGKEYQHRYPPLITKALFEKSVAVKRSFNKKRYRLEGKLGYMYRGMLRCGECGLCITPEKQKGFIYYHCTQYKGYHGAAWLREEKITEQIGQVFKSLQMPKSVINDINNTLSKLHQEKIDFHNREFAKLSDEQKNLSKMMDNLYMDKLKGRITETQYDKFYQSLKDQLTDVTIRLEQLQEADDNYFITSKYLLALVNRAYDLFVSSEVEERRQLIKLVLQNLRVEAENVVYDVQKPFDLLINFNHSKLWRGRRDSNSRPSA